MVPATLYLMVLYIIFLIISLQYTFFTRTWRIEAEAGLHLFHCLVWPHSTLPLLDLPGQDNSCVNLPFSIAYKKYNIFKCYHTENRMSLFIFALFLNIPRLFNASTSLAKEGNYKFTKLIQLCILIDTHLLSLLT